MAAILQLMVNKDMWHLSLTLDIHVTVNIDTSQNKVSADQYHMTILGAQVWSSLRSHFFLRLTADKVLVFDLDHGLMSTQVNLTLPIFYMGNV